MTDESTGLPPLEADLESLLRAERLRVEPMNDLRREILISVAATVGGLGAAGAAHAASTGTPVSTGAASTATMAGVGGAVVGKTVVIAVLSGIVGAGGGYALRARIDEAAARTRRTPVAAPAADVPAPSLVPPPEPAAPAPAPSTPPVEPQRRNPARVPAQESASTLQAEISLLDRARAALARDRVEDARAALDEHARRFEHGQLAPEREALRARLPPR